MGTDMPTNHWLDSFTSTKLIHHPVTASSGTRAIGSFTDSLPR